MSDVPSVPTLRPPEAVTTKEITKAALRVTRLRARLAKQRKVLGDLEDEHRAAVRFLHAIVGDVQSGSAQGGSGINLAQQASVTDTIEAP